MTDTSSLCEVLRRDYSPCDISDALLTLGIPGAGCLLDIGPIPSRASGRNRIVAPISTIAFVDKQHRGENMISVPGILPGTFNLPENKHWTDLAAPGSVVLMQQPSDQMVAVLGDIVATRYKSRGIVGAIIDGRARDVVSCGELCKDGEFQVWSKGLSSVGTSLEAKPWAVNIPLRIGVVKVIPGDILCADEGEGVICVIPHELLERVVEVLPKLKEADDGVLGDVQRGMDLKTAFAAYPGHYTNHR